MKKAVGTKNPRTPWLLGWEAARANAVPAFILQTIMLAILLAYYFSPSVAAALGELADLKRKYGLLFVVVAAILAGSILPELFLIAFFQKGRPRLQNFRNLAFTIPTWAVDGILVDLMYRANAFWFGDVVTVRVVLVKMYVDQFGYNPFLAAPCEVLVYEWKNDGFSWKSVRRTLTWNHYRDQILPTLLATWAVWIPLMAIIYSLPLALQFPLFSLALTFWVLLLTYMTNRFAGKLEADAPLALAIATPSGDS
ncbi:MAG: hypothetical protein M3O66_04460 [Verrucomicrobiota bacterium]|nr:hypothetical protein [Verrucomicrobiota bacterium]